MRYSRHRIGGKATVVDQVPCRVCVTEPGDPRRGELCPGCYGDMLQVARDAGFPVDDQLLARGLVARLDMGGPWPSQQPALGPCWLWRGATNKGGYGVVKAAGQAVYVHHLAHDWVHGTPGPGLERDHRCHKWDQCDRGPLCPHRRCVRPDHIQAVSLYVNRIVRGGGITAQQARRNYCGTCGKPLAGDNLYPYPDGRRGCNFCRRKARAHEKPRTGRPRVRARRGRRAGPGQMELPIKTG